MKNIQIFIICLAVLAALIDVTAATPAKKERKTMNILFGGDSISVGVGASSPAKRYATLVIKALNEKHGAGSFTELNFGISGSTLVDQPWPAPRSSGYPYVLKKVIDSKPDIVIIQHGTNDNVVGCSLGEFLWTYREFVRTVKKQLPKTKIICMTICPSWVSPISNPRWLNQANVGIQEIAALENTLLAHTNFAIHDRRECFSDVIHPNDAGHQIMADSVVKAIEANNVKSKDNFDFICSQPGQYRICGYVFEVKPQTGKDTGWACFCNVSKAGWNYTSDYEVDVTSSYKLYTAAFTVTVKNDKGSPVKSKYHWDRYTGQGMLSLPPTDSKTFEVIIAANPKEKK